ncbi:hypothetical protein SK128_026807, partial [Halocaridina rubra]
CTVPFVDAASCLLAQVSDYIEICPTASDTGFDAISALPTYAVNLQPQESMQ